MSLVAEMGRLDTQLTMSQIWVARDPNLRARRIAGTLQRIELTCRPRATPAPQPLRPIGSVEQELRNWESE